MGAVGGNLSSGFQNANEMPLPGNDSQRSNKGIRAPSPTATRLASNKRIIFSDKEQQRRQIPQSDTEEQKLQPKSSLKSIDKQPELSADREQLVEGG